MASLVQSIRGEAQVRVGPARKPRVFIAEDHTAVRELLERFLTSSGEYEVIGQSGDGREAADRVASLRPDVLVADLGLPGMDGVGLARETALRSPKTQVLVFSSHSDAVSVRRVFEAGARGMVEKGAPLATLAAALSAVAQGKAYFGDTIARELQRAMAAPAGSPDGLTHRERDVLQLVAEGLSNKEVAQRLGISLKTAENHRHHVMAKLKARNAADLTRQAFRMGLIHAAEERDHSTSSLSISSVK